MNGGYTWVCVKSRVLYHLFIFAKKQKLRMTIITMSITPFAIPQNIDFTINDGYEDTRCSPNQRVRPIHNRQ